MFKINQVFNRNNTLKPLLQEADHHQQLQQLWVLAAPEFCAYSQVLALNQGTLLIGANSGAVASRIRLTEASLIRKIQEFCQKSKKIKGLNLISIKVKVQVKSQPAEKRKRIKPPSSKALSTLEACADTVENPALQSALRNFIRHQR